MKVKVISSSNIDNFERSVNEFIKDKLVVDIKYSSYPVVTQYGPNNTPKRVDIYDRVLIMYEDGCGIS